MNSIFCKIFKGIMAVLVFGVLTGCNYDNKGAVYAVGKEPPTRSAWLAYWAVDTGEKDLGKIEKNLNKLSYFGAYFDKNDRMFIPKELMDKRIELKKKNKEYETYLSFVNDKENFDGSVVLKDIEILRRLFTDDGSMEKHIDEIITLTLQGGYDGIEIDYERIWKDEKIGQSFLIFANKLYGKALENNLNLRIVLEPNTPFASPGFSRGPEYVVMFYNLYGLHSAPGPKANKSFIQKMAKKIKMLPGETSVAFSTGGCLWGDNGEKRFLTEVEAKTLVAIYGLETKRDEESQCIVFEYKYMDVSYQVWYADADTLNYWIAIVQEQGVNNISLWRLGENVDSNKIN